VTAQKATAALVKAAPGELCWYHVQNQDAADAYLHFYDAAAAADVTVGTTTPKVTLWLPASSGVDGGSIIVQEDARGVEFALGIVIAATTTIAGSSAPTTGELVNLVYV
jgi:hypothetical protein